MTSEGLLTRQETAKLLGICERTLYDATAPRGELPVVHIGRSVRYDPADLRQWIENQKRRYSNE